MSTKRLKAPDGLTGEALAEWGRITAELSRLDILDKADRATLTLYCRTWAVWLQDNARTEREGSIFEYNNGTVGPAPWFNTADKSARMLRGLLSDLGLSPSARKKMKPKEDDGPSGVVTF